MLGRITIASLSIAGSAVTLQAAVIQTEVNPANGHTYYLLGFMKWSEAQAHAVTLGGNLATINDQAEHDWVWDTFSDGGSRNLWIGLTDSADYGTTEGNWIWISGEPVTYTNWSGPLLPNVNEQQPSNDDGIEHFAHMWPTGGGKWNDRPDMWPSNANPHNAVVEIIPEPASIALLTVGGLAIIRRR